RGGGRLARRARLLRFGGGRLLLRLLLLLFRSGCFRRRRGLRQDQGVAGQAGQSRREGQNATGEQKGSRCRHIHLPWAHNRKSTGQGPIGSAEKSQPVVAPSRHRPPQTEADLWRRAEESGWSVMTFLRIVIPL